MISNFFVKNKGRIVVASVTLKNSLKFLNQRLGNLKDDLFQPITLNFNFEIDSSDLEITDTKHNSNVNCVSCDALAMRD